mmetsp:Transcript_30946/g.70078  ORF Transcript_30946/g.70078 Transcript_30946/m.70078 type:complete len:286 (-) Transcript_30946:38-895(-)
MLAAFRSGRFLAVIVFAQQASDGEPSAVQVLRVNVEVADPLQRMSVSDFEVHPPKLHPLGILRDGLCCAVPETASLLCLRPLPRKVQLLEVHVGTLSTQPLRLCLHMEQRVLEACLPWDVYQGVPAWHHQVEPLTIDVLQVRIPNRRDRTPPSPSRRSRGNRRTGSRRAGSRRGSRSGSRLHGQVEGWVAGVRRKIGVVLQGCNDGDGNPAWIAVRVQPPVLGVALPSLRGQTRSSKRGPLGGRVSCQDRQYAMMARVDSTNINISASPLGRPLDPTRACCVLWP